VSGIKTTLSSVPSLEDEAAGIKGKLLTTASVDSHHQPKLMHVDVGDVKGAESGTLVEDNKEQPASSSKLSHSPSRSTKSNLKASSLAMVKESSVHE